MTTNKLIILDRDGVINYDSDCYIKSPAEWQAIPGSLDAINLLSQAHYRIAIASNQSGIRRGLYSEATLAAIHEKMHNAVKEYGGRIDHIEYCPHISNDHCKCRKPEPGMLLAIAKKFKTSLEEVYFVGDKWSDLEAARRANCLAVLLKTGYGKVTLRKYKSQINVPVYDNLLAFVENMIAKI